MGQHFSKSTNLRATQQQQQQQPINNNQQQQQQSQQQQQQQQQQSQQQQNNSNLPPSSSVLLTDQNHYNFDNVRTINIQQQQQQLNILTSVATPTNLHSIPTNINDNNNQSTRRFIIKIQLTKMESDRTPPPPPPPTPQTTTPETTTTTDDHPDICDIYDTSTNAASTSSSNNHCILDKDNSINNNLNITTQRPQTFNFKFTKNIPCDMLNSDNIDMQNIAENSVDIGAGAAAVTSTASSTAEIKLNNISSGGGAAANGSPVMVNNNFVSNFSTAPFIDEDGNDIIGIGNNGANCNLTSRNNGGEQHLNNHQQNFENNFNITVQRFQDFNITGSSSSNNNNQSMNSSSNICGGGGSRDYQDVPDINQRVQCPSTSSTTTTDTITAATTKRHGKESRNSSSKMKSITNAMCGNNANDLKSHCCRRKTSASQSSAYPSKWRCCKCACRDAVKKIVNSSGGGAGCSHSSSAAAAAAAAAATTSTNTSNCQNKIESSNKSGNSWTSRFSCANKKDNNNQLQTKSSNSNENSSTLVTTAAAATPPPPSSSAINQNIAPTQFNSNLSGGAVGTSSSMVSGVSVPMISPATGTPQPSAAQAIPIQGIGNHLAIWSPNEVIFPITARPGEILVLQCPQNMVCRIEDLDERARRLRAIEIETGVDSLSQAELDAALATPWHPIICSPATGISFTTAPVATVVHSRVDFIHCLVPDLEKITSSSFYWGKMDRYEAERLLEGKPEGTFLLRDSAQEEYLFSVTFRKYGRSLHARIEQFNHKFSFDCHDPGVFTAPTVTRLLEHYKDPSCVMFFEPMLTIPLNRNFSFSLQQLCRATIVSNISYDGIKELQLPNSLKGYLKEYHYKLRVRVKPFDETFYS